MSNQKEDNPDNWPPAIKQWNDLIKLTRLQLGESQSEFGKRFDVSHAAVSDWESGKSQAPYEVTWWIMNREVNNPEYRRGFSAGFRKAFWFVRKLENLEWVDIDYLEKNLQRMIDERETSLL